MNAQRLRVAIIGGGYAGMSAAVELARSGIATTVFEASSTLGGRARRVEVQGSELDNGLHILIGAYRETLRLICLVCQPGEDPGLRRIPLELSVHPRFRFRAPPLPFLPFPLNLAAGLVTAHGIGWRDKLQIIRLLNALKARRFKLEKDISVAQMLRANAQTEGAKRYLWFPLCTAALNTAPDTASAQIFANVLRDTFSAPTTNSDLLLPTIDLSRLFPERAARYCTEQGAKICLGARVSNVLRNAATFEVVTREATQCFDFVILAVAPQHLAGLIEGIPALRVVSDQVAVLNYCPIYSVYLGYPPSTTLPKAMLGMDAPYSQWIFDRGQLSNQPGVMGIVISAAGAHQDLPHDELAIRVHREVQTVFAHVPNPIWHQVIAEKRATFACTVGLVRPAAKTGLRGLFLAGDYVESDYPATIESAVRSGVSAARHVMEHL